MAEKKIIKFEKKSTPSLHSRLAKAETLMILALITDTLVTHWLFSQPQLEPWSKTSIKMLIVVGVFGPLFELFSRMIDSGLEATRDVTGSTFFLGRLGAHAIILFGIFLAFHWNMHRSLPWQQPREFHARSAPAEKRAPPRQPASSAVNAR